MSFQNYGYVKKAMRDRHQPERAAMRISEVPPEGPESWTAAYPDPAGPPQMSGRSSSVRRRLQNMIILS